MRVLIPTADYPPIEGGIGSVALHVSRELAALGHEVTVVAPYFQDMELFDAGEPVEVIRYRGYGLGWFRFFPLALATWPRLRSTDLILGINVAYGGVLGLAASHFLGKRYVTFGYAYEFLKFARNPIVSNVLRRTYERSALTVAISAFTRENLVQFGVPDERLETIHPGAPSPTPLSEERLAEIKRLFVLDDAEHVILSVGRFIPRKGHVTLVQAMPRILERFPKTVLVMVGQGPTQHMALREAHKLGVRNQVVCPGRLPDEEVAGLYQLCSLFALPTGQDFGGQVEGFGLVFAEANAYGKAVVAGRSGGTADAVIDGETGLLVRPDDPEALADGVISLLENPEQARRLGTNGQMRVERELNWKHFTGRMLEALEARA